MQTVMSVTKLLLLFSMVGAVFHFMNEHDTQSALKTANVSPNGFVTLPAPTNLNVDMVLVLAAEDCPEEDAQRADKLADELRRRDIPFTRAHTANFDLTDPDPIVLKRLDLIMNGTLPIVFVNGRGKANPTLDEVVSEFDREN
jgi:hypothetical protein